MIRNFKFIRLLIEPIKRKSWTTDLLRLLKSQKTVSPYPFPSFIKNHDAQC